MAYGTRSRGGGGTRRARDKRQITTFSLGYGDKYGAFGIWEWNVTAMKTNLMLTRLHASDTLFKRSSVPA